jgi:transketolase
MKTETIEQQGIKPKAQPDIILIETGSEVQLVLASQQKLKVQNMAARVVSMPSWKLFEKQDSAYKEKIFPASFINGWQ